MLRPFFDEDYDYICIYSKDLDCFNILAFQIGSIVSANNNFMEHNDGDNFFELLVLFHGFCEDTIDSIMKGHSEHGTYEKMFLIAKNNYPDFFNSIKFHRIMIKDREISKRVWRRLRKTEKAVVKKIGNQKNWRYMIVESKLEGLRDEVVTAILSDQEKIIKKNGGINL